MMWILDKIKDKNTKFIEELIHDWIELMTLGNNSWFNEKKWSHVPQKYWNMEVL